MLVRFLFSNSYFFVVVLQTIDDDIQSVSLGEWMELPDMSFRKWRETFRRLVFANKFSEYRGVCGVGIEKWEERLVTVIRAMYEYVTTAVKGKG